jgi:Uma2 family endonuclease
MRITQADIEANIPALQLAIRALTRYQREELAEWILNNGEFDDAIAESGRVWGMSAERHTLTVEEFLAIEAAGSVRHELIGGQMFEMRPPMPRHEVIVANLLGLLRQNADHGPLTLIASNLGLRLRVENTDLFYRPDVVIANLTPADLDAPYVCAPRVIVEVFSPVTEDIDRREKVLNYRHIAELEEYLLIAQRSPQVIVFRRSDDWVPIELTALDAVVEARSVQVSMHLREIYAGTSLR